MHNCKLTRNNLLDLALDEIPGARATQLLGELNDCPECHEEYEALRSTLQVSNQALRSALPSEEFWPDYRTRLQSKLVAASAQLENAGKHESSSALVRPASLSLRLWLALRSMATTSVRVPLPAAFALLLVLPLSFVVMRSRVQINPTPSAPVVFTEPKTIQVPVVQEKVITRVVYVDKKDRRSRSGTNQSNRTATPAGTNGVAGSDLSNKTALSLVGFKPTDEVKLTIIKGNYKDQKR